MIREIRLYLELSTANHRFLSETAILDCFKGFSWYLIWCNACLVNALIVFGRFSHLHREKLWSLFLSIVASINIFTLQLNRHFKQIYIKNKENLRNNWDLNLYDILQKEGFSVDNPFPMFKDLTPKQILKVDRIIHVVNNKTKEAANSNKLRMHLIGLKKKSGLLQDDL